MRVNIETHCHSCYSMDSGLTISSIVKRSSKLGLNGIIICDHDNCGITKSDLQLFEAAGMRLFKAIEFTTSEGAHIIGVSERIKELEMPRGHYRAADLVGVLHGVGAGIIIPHPFHETGIVGNRNISDSDKDTILRTADAIEVDSYKYSSDVKIDSILDKYSDLFPLLGSDAHAKRDVGAFYNSIEYDGKLNEATTFRDLVRSHTVVHQRRKKKSPCRKLIKKIKRTNVYQRMMNLLSPDIRRAIKNRLLNR